jgi:uridine kinase
LLTEKDAPLVIAIDGPSGAGKSSIAAKLDLELDVAIIPLDDFFSANIPDYKWDEFTLEEKLKYVIDWERVRAEVISPLLQGRLAQWRSFDFQSGLLVDGTYGMEKKPKVRNSAPIILIEGAYSSHPALAELVDFTIFIDVPLEERHRRISLREDPNFLEKWHQRWDEVEDYYFRTVRPKDSFDLVIDSTYIP